MGWAFRGEGRGVGGLGYELQGLEPKVPWEHVALYWDSGRLQRLSSGVFRLGLYWGYIMRIMENNMETTILIATRLQNNLYMIGRHTPTPLFGSACLIVIQLSNLREPRCRLSGHELH